LKTLEYPNTYTYSATFLTTVGVNVGAAALQRSVLRQKINYGYYDEGAKEFLKWIYAGGRKIMGLVRRRRLERDLFCSYKLLDKSLL
jgi:lysozyme